MRRSKVKMHKTVKTETPDRKHYIRILILRFSFSLQGGYWTIHVTPEEEFSYVSFETNVAMQDYSDLIDKVLRVFKPGRFTMTLFANHVS